MVAGLDHLDGKRDHPAGPGLLEQISLTRIRRLLRAIRLRRGQLEARARSLAILERERERDGLGILRAHDEGLRSRKASLQVLLVVEDAVSHATARRRDVVVARVRALAAGEVAGEQQDQKQDYRCSEQASHGAVTLAEKLPFSV